MLYVQLDTNWPDNPKIIRAGWEAAGVHAAIMCVAKRIETDGWVPRLLLARMGISDDVLATLASVGLIEETDDEVRPHDWHDRNPSQSAIAARKAAKAKAGRKGNHDRWEHPHPFDTCPICHPAQVIAGSDDDDRTSDSDRIAGPRTPTKSESESEVAIRTPLATTKLSPEQVQANVSQIRSVRSQIFTQDQNPAATADRPSMAARAAQAGGA